MDVRKTRKGNAAAWLTVSAVMAAAVTFVDIDRVHAADDGRAVPLR